MSAAPANLSYGGGVLEILDQTLLPAELRFVAAADLETVCEAIATLRVRGAPAIGIAAAYGLAVSLAECIAAAPGLDLAGARACLRSARQKLAATRPTAVNLGAALARLELAEAACCAGNPDAPALLAAIEAEALALHAQEREVCEAIAAAGLALLPESATILTHCNAGPLATGGIGTALGVILRGHAAGRRFRVYAGETRPLLQGARLTAWELGRAGVECHLIPDGAGASLLLSGVVDAVIVGADRIAANGDTANKIGTLPIALAAARAGVPFYVAAPLSSFDASAQTGAAIPIEYRDGRELTHFAGREVAAAGALAHNPAFDVTPADLITAFLTERGALTPPFR